MGQDKQLMGLKFFQQSIFALKISIQKNVKKQKIPIQYITMIHRGGEKRRKVDMKRRLN